MGSQQSLGLISRILFFIVATLAMAGFFIIGATAFLVFLGFTVIAVVVFGLRAWWLRRKFLRQYGDVFQQGQADIDALFRAHEAARRGGATKGTVKGVIVEGEIVTPSDNNK